MLFLCEPPLIISRAVPCNHVGTYRFWLVEDRQNFSAVIPCLFLQMLTWLQLKRNESVIPKSVAPHHIEENFKV